MKALTVDFVTIAQSMRDLSRIADDYYLDRTSGKVFVLSRGLIRSLEQDRSEDRADIPEWDSQMIPLAREIVLTGSERYLRVPEAFGNPENKWMMEFTRQVRAFRVRQKLILALRGRGGCQRFKEILKDAPEDGKRWLEFHLARWEQLIQGWLEVNGILGVNSRPHARAAR